jgi:hypothetical protein
MSTSPRRRIDRETAERLLSGVGADGHDDLARLLTAASAPARPAELAGEATAIAAFRNRRPGPTRPPRRRSLLRTAYARSSRTVKVALASAIVVAATGGVALAATTGALPGPLGNVIRSDNPPSRPAPPPPPADRITESPSASASAADLCRAYGDASPQERDRLLDGPRFGTLIEAAGGRDRITAYCTDLLGTGGESTAPPSTGQSADPTGKPAHPTGKPAHPTGKPAHPTGKPDKPSVGPPTARPTRQQGRSGERANERSARDAAAGTG